MPSNAHSQIIIDAYKKYTLICFLRGICIKSTLPRYATQSRLVFIVVKGVPVASSTSSFYMEMKALVLTIPKM